MAKVLSATSVRKSEAYADLKALVEELSMGPGGLDMQTVEGVRLLIGEKSRGLTATCITNMQSRLVGELRQAEMQAIADGVLLEVRKDHPRAEAKLLRGRRIELWLDGLPREIE